MEVASPWALHHEKNWGRLEKACFAGKTNLPLFVWLYRNKIFGLEEPIMEKILRIERHPAASDAALAAAAASWQHAARLLRAVDAIVSNWAIRNGTRRALAELERHHLLDIGKTPEEAKREAAKPFWRA